MLNRQLYYQQKKKKNKQPNFNYFPILAPQ